MVVSSTLPSCSLQAARKGWVGLCDASVGRSLARPGGWVGGGVGIRRGACVHVGKGVGGAWGDAIGEDAWSAQSAAYWGQATTPALCRGFGFVRCVGWRGRTPCTLPRVQHQGQGRSLVRLAHRRRDCLCVSNVPQPIRGNEQDAALLLAQANHGRDVRIGRQACGGTAGQRVGGKGLGVLLAPRRCGAERIGNQV